MPEPTIINAAPTEDQIKAIVDEIGKLDEELAPFKAKAKRLDDLRKRVLAWYDQVEAKDAYAVPGNAFVVEVSARQQERHVTSMKKLRTALGEAFWRVVRVPVTLIDEHLTKEQQGGLIETKLTGPRKLTVYRKPEGWVA